MDKKSTKLRYFYPLLLLLLSMVAITIAFASDELPDGSDRPVTVMTRNVYLGADLSPIFLAIGQPSPDPAAIGQAVFDVYSAALGSDFPGRAAAIAGEINASRPALVGLQEAIIWDGPLGGADFTQLIMDQLALQGAGYRVVVVAPGFSQTFPVPPFGEISLEVRDVLLARTDLPESQLKLANVQTGNYAARVVFPLFGSQIELPRQWASVDVKIRGRTFRFITTHLESIEPPLYPVDIRYLQTQELLAGPAATDLPVILVGDFNSDPADGNAAQLLLGSGFASAASGDTCCHPHNLSDRDSTFEKQIDLILTRGDFRVSHFEITGDQPADFDVLGRWPSDHGGVVATLLLPDDPD